MLRRTPSNADNLALAQATAGEQHYYTVFVSLRGSAGQSTAAVARALTRLDAVAAQVLRPLAVVQRVEGRAAAAAAQASDSAQGQARVIGILGGILVMLAGTAFAVFMVLLLRRSAAREEELRATLSPALGPGRVAGPAAVGCPGTQ